MIPQTFPTIGEFGGVEQIGDGCDNLQIDSNFIAADIAEAAPSFDEEDILDLEPPIVSTEETESNGVDGDAHTFHAAVRQPPGECDPEYDLPCSCPRRSFAEPPEQLPRPATKINIQALEG